MATNDDELPPEVQAEVDAARSAGEPDQSAESEPAAIPEPKLSRRQQAEQERIAEMKATRDRAEAAEKIAADIRDEYRKNREADVERSARLETALQMLAQQRQHEPQQRREEGPSATEKMEKLEAERDKALSDGDVNTYHKRLNEIAKLYASESMRAEATARDQAFQRFQQQQPQQMQKPPWVTAVESQYGDVMIHPRGTAAVAAFVQLSGAQVGPETLDAAFKRAREELGLAKRKDDKNEQQRQVLSGGGSNAIPRGNGKTAKNVNMPAGWRETARRAGIGEDDYKRSYIEMHPEAVVRE